MGTLVGVLIFAIAAAVVLPDVLNARRAAAPRGPSSSVDLLPGAINDPRVTDLNSRIDALAIAVGSIAGRGAGGTTGSAISGAEVGLAKGLGANTISDDEIRAIVARTAAAGQGAGAAAGTNAGELAGGGIGSGIASFPVAVVEGALQGGSTAFDRLFKLADRLNLPKL